MPRISDYIVIRDGAFNLSPDEDKPGQQSFSIEVNDDAVRNASAILSFRMHAHSNPNNLVFDVHIDNHLVFKYPFGLDGETCQTVHEIVNRNVLTLDPGLDILRFSALSGSGTVSISDVVLHFQRDI
ncbi:MAG: hypothetical protein AAFW75_13290 [Cyanobacteria bacterium J06636_16]